MFFSKLFICLIFEWYEQTTVSFYFFPEICIEKCVDDRIRNIVAKVHVEYDDVATDGSHCH